MTRMTDALQRALRTLLLYTGWIKKTDGRTVPWYVYWPVFLVVVAALWLAFRAIR